ncbi:VHS domain-containing protein [Ditylenchus destructor]|uniref:VHS domain-containing protein n=1 Tax=Ditylenchus destructor TaxID=166010 RepID=A0AAD4RC50_9BILA|nr:VHS domain-containing protein [Ditylenchus destructor]
MTNVQEKMSNVQGQVVNAVESAAAKVTDFFQGNPFESVIGRKIELATDATKLATENWGLNMEICDYINNTNEGGRDAIRAIRKRLQLQIGKNNAIVMYTLTLLETCVKNCNQRFKALVCQKDFVNDMVKLIGAKFDAPQIIQERVLSLIQSWADAFRGNPALSGVVEVYEELKSKGVEFPAVDLDSLVPIVTPRRTIFPEQQYTTAKTENVSIVQSISGPISASPEQLAKFRSELDIVNVNLTVLRELIATSTPNRESPEEFELMQQLYTTCQEMQRRILELIPVITNEEMNFSSSMMNLTTGIQSATASSGDLIDLGNSQGKSLSEQLQSFGMNEGNKQESSKQAPNENYVHDQANEGLSKTAFNKLEDKPNITDQEAQEISGWLNTARDSKLEAKKEDDGL